MEDESVIHYGIRVTLGCILGEFYVEDGIIGLQDLERLQGDLNVLIRIFWSVGLMAHIANSRTMICLPGAICIGISEEGFSRRKIWEGATYQERLRRRISLLE